MDEKKKYHIKISGEGLSLEKDIPGEIAKAIVDIVLSESAPINRVDRQVAPPKPLEDEDPHVSITEFVKAHNPKRNPDLITCIGYFLKKHLKKKDFSKEDVITAFEDAQLTVPGYIQRDINWTITLGWIAKRSDDKNRFYVTTSGEKVVDDKFPKEVLAAATLRTRRKKKTTPAKKGSG